MLTRLACLIMKELQAILGNRQGRILLIMPIILQTALFPFAATLEVKNSTLIIYNEDGGAASVELVQRLSQTAAFTKIIMAHGENEIREAIDSQNAFLALQIPPDFSRRLLNRQTAPVQIVIDGRRSNSAQIASGYASQVVNDFALEQGGRPLASISLRNLYNPNLDYKWHVLPSLVAIITTIGCLIVTALSVAREREEGTFDQLLVSPLTPVYIMVGKAVPGVLVAVAQGSFIVLVARFIYRVPFTGSTLLLFTGMTCYGLALAGIGLFISSLCETQQQAFFGVFSFMVPAVMLSGYVAPIENMPVAMQWVAHLDPLSYFIPILKGVFLKGFGFGQAWSNLWPLLAIAAWMNLASHPAQLFCILLKCPALLSVTRALKLLASCRP